MLFVSEPTYRPVIVIATYNGANVLPKCVASIRKLRPKPILIIVDTGSTEYGFLESTKKLADIFLECPKGYDTAAYIKAAQILEDDREVFFCHDSIEFKHPDALDAFTFMLRKDKVGLVAWVGFPLTIWDSLAQKQFFKTNSGIEEWSTTHGVFGPIFMAHAKLAKDVGKHLQRLPASKIEQQGMERSWTIIAEHLGHKTCALHHPQKIFESINNDVFSDIRKIILRRM